MGGRTLSDMVSDRIALSAAGCAFYATLSLFPAISILISLYGMIFDPVTVEPQLRMLRGLVPASAFTLVSDWVHHLVSRGSGTLSLPLLISFLAAFWSATSGTKAMLSALNVAYDEQEKRSVLQFQATAFALTFCAVLAAILAIWLLVALPPVMNFLHMTFHQALLMRGAGFGVMLGFVLLALSLLYRFGPSRTAKQRQAMPWLTIGALAATALWLVASAAFSFYVTHIASYGATYGPLGAVVGMMLWFYVTAYAVLLGAELNAELEQQAAPSPPETPPTHD